MRKSKVSYGVKPGNEFKHSILSAYQYQLEKQAKAEEAFERAFNRAAMTTTYLRSDKVQGGEKRDLYDKVNDLQPLKERLRAEIIESARVRMEIYELTKTVKSTKLSLFLHLIYIEGIDYKEAKARMRDRCKMADLHNEALEAVDISGVTG